MSKLIIFDFDDTLVHLDINWKNVKQEILSEMKGKGITLDEKQPILEMCNSVSNNYTLKKIIDNIFIKYEKECISKNNYQLFLEMFALVNKLKAKGYKIAIVSGNSTFTIEQILTFSGAIDKFDILCGRDIVEKTKPEKMQIDYVLDKLGIKNSDSLFIGDSDFDKQAANAANIEYFKITNPEQDAASLEQKLLSD